MIDQVLSTVPHVTDVRKREFGYIKKLNKSEGYAFIDPDSGGHDVFLSLMEAQQGGVVDLSIGMRVSFRRYSASDGRSRATDVSVAKPRATQFNAGRKSMNRQKSFSPRTAPSMPGEWREATVKFYDPEKGYGFVAFADDDRDAFLSRYTIQASQLDPELRLKQVPARVVTVPGKKPGTIEVFSIELI